MSDLALVCGTCHKPISDSEGCLYIRLAEVTEAQVAEREWGEAHPPGSAIDIVEMLTIPDHVTWRAAHDACRTDRDESCYEIACERIATWRRLCFWTAHLMGKSWFGLSDWDVLLEELAQGDPRRIAVRLRSVA